MALLTLVAFLGIVIRVAAQTGVTTAQCNYAEWTSFNGMSPCQIWANLQAACDPNAMVGPLNTSVNSNAHYPVPLGPTATLCQCNVVAYNLMAGCSWCQPNVYSQNWVSEAQWQSGCSNYDPSGLPSQVSALSGQIPSWALLADNGGPWESFEASSIAVGVSGTATFSSAPFGATGAFTTKFNTGTGFPVPTNPPSGNDNGAFNSEPTIDLGLAVGVPVGVVLGLYVLLGGILLAVIITRQKKRKAWYGPMAQYYRNGGRMEDKSQPPVTPNVYGEQQQNPFATPSPTGPAAFMVPPSPNPSYGPGSPEYNQMYSNQGYNPGYGNQAYIQGYTTQYYGTPVSQPASHPTSPAQPVIQV